MINFILWASKMSDNSIAIYQRFRDFLDSDNVFFSIGRMENANPHPIIIGL